MEEIRICSKCANSYTMKDGHYGCRVLDNLDLECGEGSHLRYTLGAHSWCMAEYKPMDEVAA